MRFRPRRDPHADAVRELFATLTVPQPWRLADFVGQIAARTGTRIQLVPLRGVAAEDLPCGLLLERAEDVVIAYDATISDYHGDHIVLHEIGHLLLGHRDGRPSGAQHANIRTLFPSVDPATVVRVLARSDYDDGAERQAELFASLIMSEARSAPGGSRFRRELFGE